MYWQPHYLKLPTITMIIKMIVNITYIETGGPKKFHPELFHVQRPTYSNNFHKNTVSTSTDMSYIGKCHWDTNLHCNGTQYINRQIKLVLSFFLKIIHSFIIYIHVSFCVICSLPHSLQRKDILIKFHILISRNEAVSNFKILWKKKDSGNP